MRMDREPAMTSNATVCVVIAARDAAATIGRAVASALRDRHVAEVVAVDDGSSDGTAEAALAADDRSGRLNILRLDANRGPAFARNHAIARSSAPLIAILDADDFFLKGRFDRLLCEDDWDFVADNIVFIDEESAKQPEPAVPDFAAEPRFLDLPGFVDGNISRRGASRGEIGFLKPVMRRSFLDGHGLAYDEGLRLGEDYDLYARALLKGARYKVVHGCGYGAVVRADSLSGRHRTADLKRLYEADRAMLALPEARGRAQVALRRHERHVRARYELRRFLDIKASKGLASAGLGALSRPTALPAIVGGVATDKFDAFRARLQPSRAKVMPRRYLLTASTVQK
jgi:succinoglycan biosynthesis protein ExoU